MTDTPALKPAIVRLNSLPDAFWQNVMATPWRYDLFTLLRRVDARGGERYPLGRAPLPRFESLRVGQTPSLSFAPSTLWRTFRSGCRSARVNARVCRVGDTRRVWGSPPFLARRCAMCAINFALRSARYRLKPTGAFCRERSMLPRFVTGCASIWALSINGR